MLPVNNTLVHRALWQIMDEKEMNLTQAARFIGVARSTFCDWLYLAAMPRRLTLVQTGKLLEWSGGQMIEDLWPPASVREPRRRKRKAAGKILHSRKLDIFPLQADRRILSEQLVGKVNEVLLTLIPREARIIKLYFLEEWTMKKVAQAEGITEARGNYHLRRALGKLRSPTRARQLALFI